MISEGKAAGKPPLILDVRNSYEWDAGHFEGAERPLEVRGAGPAARLQPGLSLAGWREPGAWRGRVRLAVVGRPAAPLAAPHTLNAWTQHWAVPPQSSVLHLTKCLIHRCSAGQLPRDAHRGAAHHGAALPRGRRPRPARHDLLHRRHPLRRLRHVPAPEGVRAHGRVRQAGAGAGRDCEAAAQRLAQAAKRGRGGGTRSASPERRPPPHAERHHTTLSWRSFNKLYTLEGGIHNYRDLTRYVAAP